jgi:hypothetical protein
LPASSALPASPVSPAFPTLPVSPVLPVSPASLSAMKKKFDWHRLILLAIVGTVYVFGYLYLDRWHGTLYGGDSNGYYLHVVSFFIYDDVGDYEKSISALKEIHPSYIDPRDDIYGIQPTTKGRMYIKYPLGVGLLETPFFFVGHLVARASETYEANGWSTPYAFFIGLSTIVYVLFGMSLLFSVLTRYFSKRLTLLALLSIALATNLFYQSTYVTMSHGFLFFLQSLLIYLTVRFYSKPRLWTALSIGGTIGMIAMTRVPEVISGLVPLFWGVYNRTTLMARLRFFWNYPKVMLFAVIGFFMVFSLQIGYWHFVSGKLFFNPYSAESFNFLRPRILDGWFNFANGWLIYSPIMALSIAGCFFLRKHCTQVLVPLILLVGIHTYVHYSWHAWMYYPGFGSRPMVDMYPLLSFGLTAFYLICHTSRWAKWIPVTAFICFSVLNLFQTWQQNAGIIRSERHNKAFYVESFGKMSQSLQALRAYDSGKLQPDINDLILIGVLASENFEDSTGFTRSNTIKQSGEYSLYDASEYTYTTSIPLRDVFSGNWLEIGVSAFVLPTDKVKDRDHCAVLVAELYNDKGRRKDWSCIPIAAHIGNIDNSIWSTGEVNMWDTASYFMKIPGKVRDNWILKVEFWNPGHQNIHLDDFFVKYWRRK